MADVKIHYIQPYRTDKNIGKAINETIQNLRYEPDDFIILTDHDTLWLLPDSKAQVERILMGTDYDILGCMTNRIRSPEQLINGRFIENDSIRDHIVLAEKCRENAGDYVKEAHNAVAAFCMCFRVSVWVRVSGFVENVLTFDSEFCREARVTCRAKVGIMCGVYVWHSYRLDKKNPKSYIKHLEK
jgi:hypothetical protein